jgi:pilus assembly protein CpaB
MRLNTIFMLGLAAIFGVLSVMIGQRWLSHQANLQRQQIADTTIPQVKNPPVTTIIVAATPLRYGDELTPKNTRVIAWPSEALPQGAFKTLAELNIDMKRIVLAPMEENEPILPAKITGPGQRATLSRLISEGMGAATIHVNEIIGVAGFVQPEDRVDVVMTRLVSGGDGGTGAHPSLSFSDVVLHNIRVLAIGQIVDQKSEKPTIVNAVTLEVSPLAAQKLQLAVAGGTLSLFLRKAGEMVDQPSRRVLMSEVGAGTVQDEAPSSSQVASTSTTTTVRVFRPAALKPEEINVLSEEYTFNKLKLSSN